MGKLRYTYRVLPGGRRARDVVSAPEATLASALVDDATAADILNAVGDDPERAAEALALELARDKPRKGLVAKLERMAP